MQWLAKTSIARRLKMVLLFITSIALLLSTTGFLVNDWFSLRNALFDRLNAEARIISSNSVAAMAFNDPDSATKTLQTLQSEESILAAGLFDLEGNQFAKYQREEGVLPAVLPSEDSGFAEGLAFVVLPVELDNSHLGDILLISDFRDWKRRQQVKFLISTGVFALSLVIAILLSSRMQRLVSDPIIKLAQTARQVTEQQDYRLRAEKTTEDEIGRLVVDFNGMLQQIQSRDQELQEIQGQLEEKVEARTRQLTELTKQLEYQAYHDPLTGLANRTTFDDHLRLAIEQVDRYGGELAVLFLDLDRFKDINDSLGHDVGDKLLVKVAKRFSRCMRSSDTLARLGGDEFGVLLQRLEHAGDAADVARKLTMTIAEPFNIDDYKLHLSTSIGISIYPSDGNSAEVILKNADTAMYSSKERGRNLLTFFSLEMNARAERRLKLENKLRQVLREGGLDVYYQPRCNALTNEIVGVEALVRWFDPDHGPISPGEFIPVAEECGLIANIDEWVLETACHEVKSWYGGRAPEISLAVNFSPVQFVRRDLDKVIDRILKRTDFPGSHLEMEITESLFGLDNDDINQIFEQLVQLDVEIAVDDFGTAYSSLSRLKQLPLHTLKIDQSFVRDLGKDTDDEAIVRTIIALAHNLNLKVVAEGVETELQLQFVRDNGCDTVQGFLFSKPVPGSELVKLLGGL
jgi:diguanylate cyclase (GGDEF)-like protein